MEGRVCTALLLALLFSCAIGKKNQNKQTNKTKQKQNKQTKHQNIKILSVLFDPSR
jgi:hypothetical protein